MTFAALILAAGTSSRAGEQNKLLHNYLGLPLISHLVKALDASTVQRCVATTGHQHNELERVLEPAGITCVFNADYRSGMASSLVTGVSALLDAEGILVCLGDMPHINARIINLLIDAAVESPDKNLIVPCSNGQRGNPVLIRQGLFDRVLSLTGDSGAKILFTENPETVLEVPMDTAAVLQDYDTAEALSGLSSDET